jgi:indole-3-glycerol phosphate synthase/dTDP-glucose pyrophosphorylase
VVFCVAMKAVILAAGKGTRMKELTNEVPKPMLKVQGKPILEHILQGILAAGIREVFIVTGFRADVIENHFGDGSKWQARIAYGRQVVQDGTGKAPELAKDFVGSSPLLLTYGDILVPPETYPQMLRRFKEGAFSGVITVTPGQDVTKGGLNFFDEQFCLQRLVEKPNPDQLEQLRREGWLKPNEPVWYNAGIYIFKPVLFDFTAKLQKSPRGEYELTDAVNALLIANHKLAGLKIQGRWVDVRDPEVLADLEQEGDGNRATTGVGAQNSSSVRTGFFLDQILRDTEQEITVAKKALSVGDLKRMIRDAPPLRSFRAALAKSFGIIAEVKRRSPSAGDMPARNFDEAPTAYAKSPVVRAVSVLTNSTHFGMGIRELKRIRQLVPQPVLRKDFLIEEYQVYEARAFGADAVLLMANVLDRDSLKRLFTLARELELDVLFEAHTKEEIENIPGGAEIYGINSRRFKAAGESFVAKMVDGRDLSVELETFSLIQYLPKGAIKVAESGVKPDKIRAVARMGYDAVLVGTSLLIASEGVEKVLREFEQAMLPPPQAN